MRRGDDRAVTVQIGAVLLLAILFSALALYQINVVPAENEGVEISHNQAVQNELQDLRNGVQNAGLVGTPQATSVTLGTQYPTRTVSTNPLPPTGTLETTGDRTIRLENARATAGNDALVGSHTTTTLAYEPDYNEYRSAPTTRIEHAVAFNDFGNAAVQLPGPTQQLVDGDRNRLTIVLLVGSLSETTAGAVSVDAEPLDGNPGTATIEPDDPDAPIELTIPTESPAFWNDTLEDESETTAAAYDDDSNQLTVHLEGSEYDLRMSTVGIGEYDATAGYDAPAGGHDGGSDAPYDTFWHDPAGQSSVDDDNCTADSCVVTGNSVALTMGTDGVAADASVDYAVSDPAVGTVSPGVGTTDDGGTHSTTFDVASDASDGDTVDVYTTSGGDGDAIRLEISRDLAITTVDVTDTSDESTNQAAFDVAYTVEDDDGSFEEFDRVAVEFENVDNAWATQTDSSPDTAGQFEYQEGGVYGDTYRITLQVIDTDGNVADERVGEYVADGDSDSTDDSSSTLEIETFDVTDTSDGETDRAAFDVAYAVADTDGNHEEFDRVEIEFENVDNDWATETDSSADTSGEFAYERDGAHGDTYRITLQVYETDGSLADEATEAVVASGDTYEIDSVSLASGGGNDIDVTVDVETTDSNAELVVRSLQSNGDERDRVTVAATDGTYTVGGGNQADEVEVLLFDGDGVERASQTEPWNG